MKLDKVIAVRTNKTVYRDGDLAIKVFDEDYSQGRRPQRGAQPGPRGGNRPQHPQAASRCSTMDGKWAIVSDFIPGKTLAQLMEENPDKRDEYLDLFVDLQMEVHAQDVPRC